MLNRLSVLNPGDKGKHFTEKWEPNLAKEAKKVMEDVVRSIRVLNRKVTFLTFGLVEPFLGRIWGDVLEVA